MKTTTAIILAAGIGKRLKPIVTPKSLLPFLGKPLIEWLIEDLKKVGLTQFIIVTSPENKAGFLKLAKSNNIKLAIQSQPTGMAGAVLSAQSKLSTKSMLIVNGNDLLSFSTIDQFISLIKSKADQPAVTGLKSNQNLSGGYFKLKGDKLTGIIEKPKNGQEPSPYFNLVLHYFPSALDFCNLLNQSKSTKDDAYEVALNQLIQKTKVNLIKTSTPFAQLKYPHQILDVMSIFLNHRLEKKITVHKTAKIMAGAIIKGPVYIAKNVIVGNNALVRNSIIEEGSVIGFATEIARSYIGPNNWFHCNYIGDSVVESNSNFGSGARLANLRFDENKIKLKHHLGLLDTAKSKFGAVIAKGSKLGINTSLMPGVTVGENSIIGSGVVLNHSVDKNTTVYLKQELNESKKA